MPIVMSMQKTLIIAFILFFVPSGNSFGDDIFETKPWHTKEREYLPTDSVIFPIVDYHKVMTVKIGDTLAQAEDKLGFKPVKYYIHPGFALMTTRAKNKLLEVAFRYNDEDIIIDISFKEMEKK
jgi:hypothetical protein